MEQWGRSGSKRMRGNLRRGRSREKSMRKITREIRGGTVTKSKKEIS